MRKRNEEGAAAVEFALILPVLLLILIGIIEFSLAFNAQLSLNQAAREGARYMAIHNNAGDAATAAGNAAGRLAPASVSTTFSFTGGGTTCAAGKQVTATTSYTLTTVTGFLDAFTGNIAMTGKGTMSCGG
ncbi:MULTISPECIES: TadE/TadG family type IV pilus assembly protein [unclassified Arthrobacter]|uniref:TadE/TadG family type IV pilus assembly protein n=1 Tax=unclassified Arthrobacter TaxID=235627 RepID=UPI001EEF984B|nr:MULTISPECIES: TadE family protein [unclassified Arthrobacter]UKA70020.1 pilus assembly protein [Arthrobacter sp. FW306-06-A]UKA74318.1 pilus assembly protein [Arthrobacter sp. FW306-07-I]